MCVEKNVKKSSVKLFKEATVSSSYDQNSWNTDYVWPALQPHNTIGGRIFRRIIRKNENTPENSPKKFRVKFEETTSKVLDIGGIPNFGFTLENKITKWKRNIILSNLYILADL